MIKSLVSFVLSLAFLCSVAFAATRYESTGPAPLAPLPSVSAVLPDPAPFVFESSAVLVLAKPAPVKVARHVAPKAKSYQCGAWEASNVGGAFKRCEWR